MTSNTIKINDLSFNSFIQNVLPQYSVDSIKQILKGCSSYTNTVRRCIKFNKNLNIRTIFCIYNNIILPEIIRLSPESIDYYNDVILQYLNAINKREHHINIALMPSRHLNPDIERLETLSANNREITKELRTINHREKILIDQLKMNNRKCIKG